MRARISSTMRQARRRCFATVRMTHKALYLRASTLRLFETRRLFPRTAHATFRCALSCPRACRDHRYKTRNPNDGCALDHASSSRKRRRSFGLSPSDMAPCVWAGCRSASTSQLPLCTQPLELVSYLRRVRASLDDHDTTVRKYLQTRDVNSAVSRCQNGAFDLRLTGILSRCSGSHCHRPSVILRLFGLQADVHEAADGLCAWRQVGLLTPPFVDLLHPAGRSNHFKATRFFLAHMVYVSSVDNVINP